jgi:hypothetical protein
VRVCANTLYSDQRAPNWELGNLMERTLGTWKAALAISTEDGRATARKTFLAWCGYYQRVPVPANEATMALYARSLADNNLTYGTIKNYITGVRVLHTEHGIRAPAYKGDYHFNRVMQGIKRELGNFAKQKLHITPQILLDMEKCIVKADRNERMFFAACLLAFYTLFRKSNFTAPTELGFVPTKHLCRRDVRMKGNGTLEILSQWSKTNQFHERELVFPVAPAGCLELNAVAYVCAYFMSDSCAPDAPAFRVKKANRFVPMTGRWFVKKLKNVLVRAGYDADNYSGHSFRAGGATWAFECGLNSDMIKLLGDWRSDTYLGYLRLTDVSKLEAARLLAGRITSR